MKVDGVMETMVNKQPVEPVMPVIDESALPDGWALKTIGEVCEKAEKVDPTANPDAEFRYIDIGGIDNQLLRIVDAKTYLGKDAPSRARQLVKANDVVISTVRTYLKNIALVPDDLDGQVASTGFCVLRSSDMWMGKYLYYFVQSDAVLKEIGKQQRGTSYPAVRDSDIKAQFIPVPPKREVRRIVEAIELQLGRLDAAVARLQGAKARLKRYKQAVLKAAFTEGDYPVTTIGEVYEVFVGSTPSRSKPELWNGPIHWVSSGEVAFCDIEDTRERITEEGLGNRATRLHPPGTVMLAMIGEGKTRGQAAILRVPAAHNQNTAAIRMPAPEYSPEYLYFYFMYEYDNTRRVGGGNNQMALNKSRIRAIEIPMPDPDEQTRIAAAIKERFATVDETEATLDAQLQQAVRLRQAVLKRAFEGRLV